MKRVIITGATGAVGTALINEMVKNKIEVLVFCREGSMRNFNIPNHPLVSKKYCLLNQLSEIENDTGKNYDVFYHLAWEGTTGSARNDMYIQNNNVRYTLDAVGAASRFGCHTFIGAGTQAEYGRVEGLLTSSTPVFPENGYGIAKLCAGQMSRILCHQLGIKHIWTRILSVYGPYDGENTMIMSTIVKLMNGDDPKFTKGEQMWDYLYSGDAANAMYLLGYKGQDGKVYCLGSGTTRPLYEYIYEIRDLINKSVEIQLGAIPYDENQVMYLCADISDLIEDTGFAPIILFESGVRKTIKWIKEDKNIF